MLGWEAWRRDPVSSCYDWELLLQRLEDMDRLEATGDVRTIAEWLRGGLARGLGGTANPDLDRRALAGTKLVVEEHQRRMVRLLTAVCDAPDEAMPLEDRLTFLSQARHVHGKAALLLSGGAGLGMFHFGVVMELRRHGLLPRIISGASAGSIVAAIVCTRSPSELDELLGGGAEHLAKTLDLNFFDKLCDWAGFAAGLHMPVISVCPQSPLRLLRLVRNAGGLGRSTAAI